MLFYLFLLLISSSFQVFYRLAVIGMLSATDDVLTKQKGSTMNIKFVYLKLVLLFTCAVA